MAAATFVLVRPQATEAGPMDHGSSTGRGEPSALTATMPDCSPWPSCREPGDAEGDSSSPSAGPDGSCEARDGTDSHAECSKHAKAITLSPASDATRTGLRETLTAKVTSGRGVPVAGVVVTFTIKSGPNAGTTGTGTTGSDGLATFVYTSAEPGTDVVRASFMDGETHQSNRSVITWKRSPPPSLPELRPAVVVPIAGLVTSGFVLRVRRRRLRR